MRSRLAARQDLRHKIRALRRSCAPRANHLYTMGRNLLAEDIRRSIAAPLASSLEWFVIRDFSVKDLFSANRDSCGNASVRVSQKPPVGQITENLSSPQRKNIPLSPSGKSALPARAIPFRKRGVGHRHERWDGMRWTRQRRVRLGWQGKLRLVSNQQARGTNGAASVFIKASAACTVGEAS